MPDMISSAVGGRVVECNDEFFAEAANLLNPATPVWDEAKFTDRGKWMDGWETRRRREPGHDWCIIALGIPGRIESVDIDTAHFTGNYAEEFSLEACGVATDDQLSSAVWTELIPKTGLKGDSAENFTVDARQRVTYLRLNIFPDGGVARLRAHGFPIPGMAEVCPDSGVVDLVSQVVGGAAVDASDAHYSPPSNMIRRTEPQGMWDGWETRRRRGPGFDWATFDLGLPGLVRGFVVDTRHFKGNPPGWVTIHTDDGHGWTEVISRAKISADTENRLEAQAPVEARQVKLEIHPDGGVARFRVLGTPHREAAGRKRIEYLNSLFDQQALSFFNAACSSAKWSTTMAAARPFATPAAVFEHAETVFATLEESDWLEAFAGHPRIGEKGDDLAEKEQSGTGDATATTLAALADANARYEARFGFTYIVYATGKSADEMLAMARERMGNSPKQELEIAASQQRLITATRLSKMLCQAGHS